MKKVGLFFILFTIAFTLSARSTTLDNAVEEAVSQLKSLGVNKYQQLVLEVKNYDSGEKDRQARKIQGIFFSSIQSYFPDSRIMLIEEAVVGVSLKAIKLKVTYQVKGEKTLIQVIANDQMTGKVIATAQTKYDNIVKNNRNLIAVLDLEAPTMNEIQRKTFSNVFRSFLQQTGKFSLIAQDAIDQANADKIQEEFQCSREECATIIAEQLSAENVVTVSYSKVTNSLFYLTANLKDISTGENIVGANIKHDGDLNTLDRSLENLACQLAKNCNQEGSIKEVQIAESPLYKQEEPAVVAEQEEISEESEELDVVEESNLTWHVTAITLTAVSAFASLSEAQSYNDLAKENEDLRDQFNSATSLSEFNSLKSQYEDNQDAMKRHSSNIQIYDAVTILALIWEGSLLYSEFTAPTSAVASSREISDKFYVQSHYTPQDVNMSFNYTLQW